MLACASFLYAPSALNANSRCWRELYFIATEIFDKSNFHCNKNNPLTNVRGFALAGAIGIEPTQWESEAQVLPLHQAPSLKALYNIDENFANTFCK